jgi:hypothetical protein
MAADPIGDGERITRSDIESKLRDLRGDVDETARAALPKVALIGAVTAVAVIGLAYFMGRRSGRKRSAVVEIRRL